MIRRILDTLLEADSQPRDWYAWATNQLGHGVIGMPLALVAHALWVPLLLVPVVVALRYFLIWELLLQTGDDLTDSLWDAVHVGMGAGIMSLALQGNISGLSALFILWGILLAYGVCRRIGVSSDTDPL